MRARPASGDRAPRGIKDASGSLLVGAGLFVGTLVNLQRVDLGIDRDNVLLFSLAPAIGLPASLAATRVVKAMLFGLQPHDPAALALAAMVLMAFASVAGFLPARRAARVEPVEALRYE